MSSRKSEKTMTDRFIKNVTDKIRSLDKYTLICFITGVIFFILGTVQLVLIMTTPVSPSFDYVSIILLDFIIVAFCLVYVLYKSGRLDGILPDGVKDNQTVQEQDDDSQINVSSGYPEDPRNADEQPVHDFIGMGHRISSAVSSNQRRGSDARLLIDESLISPGHRYSSEASDRQKTVASQERVQNGQPSHDPNSTQRPRFNSHGRNG